MGKVDTRVIRVKKEESAFLYFVLEAREGLTFYSTLPHQSGDAHRDIELMTPVDFLPELEALLKQLGQENMEIIDVTGV